MTKDRKPSNQKGVSPAQTDTQIDSAFDDLMKNSTSKRKSAKKTPASTRRTPSDRPKEKAQIAKSTRAAKPSSTAKDKRKRPPLPKFTQAMHFVTVRPIKWIWSSAHTIDRRLWQIIKTAGAFIGSFITAITDAIIDSFKAFLKWLPTRAGMGYCAFSGFIAIIAGLWAADQIRAAEMAILKAQNNLRPTFQIIDTQDPILARIGSDYIRLSQLQETAHRTGQLDPDIKLNIEDTQTIELLTTLIDQRVLARATREEKLDQRQELQDRLQTARDRILAASYIENLIATQVSEEKVRDLYEAQSDVTSLGKEIRIRHILVESKAKANTILTALQSGEDFAALAIEHSLDRGTAPHGGDTGFITHEMLDEEFSRIAFAFDINQISPPFKTKDGWNIVKITDKRQTKNIPFEQVEDNLRRFLTLQTIEQTLKTLREQYDVETYPLTPTQ